MALVVVDGVPMSSNMVKRLFFTCTDITCGMCGVCGLSVPKYTCICQTSLHIIFSFLFYRNNGNDLL